MTTLTEKPGISLIKAGTFKLNDLSKLLEVEGLKSDMAEVAVTNNSAPLTIGHFTMSPGVEFEYFYDSVEYKVVTKGKIVMRDMEGNKYVAEVGDVILFSADVKVIFDAESDGEAIYTAHRQAAEDFAPAK
ncbi:MULTISPECIES: hypothetical protein [Photobacterium]|uniref:Uncharacterized protein n=6 Tax=Photobacterium TaxID=657 RepID=A0A2T3IJE8_9GAMM|nr:MULTISPECIES: hypothetical protein [Photobacterium]KPA53778.1 hypothetical protein VT25_05385 [Photobacterium leiognathi subsp. mandapamensis]OBU16507.1 hypothetical protein AYY19_15355 [Photobacterium aquimaris]PHZ60161.1 hypothetical protein CRG86_002640 [Photobacterium leiognathi]PSU26361.1 hypothetical protein CTM88_16305 [Photobacterium aquimaris]PSU28479.1 hypothetical protein CTM88_12460 [Photobacterium aquimaris]